MNWIFLALLAVPFFIFSEYIFKNSDCSNLDCNIYVYILVVCLGIYGLLGITTNRKQIMAVKFNTFITIGAISLSLFVGMIIYWNSCKKSPIPGYTRAVFSGALVVGLLLLTFFLDKGTLTKKQILGIISIIFGIILIN